MRKFIMASLMLSVSLISGGCGSISKSLNADQITSINEKRNGGLVVDVTGIDGVPCTHGSVVFQNLETKQSVHARFVFGMFGMSDATNVVPAMPGRYVPTSGNCTQVYQSGGYEYRKQHPFVISANDHSPAIVEFGKVTYPGSYEFSGSRRLQSYKIVDRQDAISKMMKSKYSKLEFQVRMIDN